jgi:hypothetical protein
MGRGIPCEPSAEHRQAAAQLRQMFVALVNEGFTEHQALVIIGQMLATNRPQGDET